MTTELDIRIKSVTAGDIRNMFPRLVGRNSKRLEIGYGLSTGIVIIEAENGVRGFGVGQADRTMIRKLEGKAVREVFDPAIGVLDDGLSEADMALHDLAGKLLGIPVAKMINPNAVLAVPCYDGAIYQDDICYDGRDLGVEEVLKNCRADAKRGYTSFKIKIGRGKNWMTPEQGTARDAEVIRAVRNEFPDAELMIDANDGYTPDSAIALMEKIKDCRITWFEEPFVENAEDCRRFKKYLAENAPETLLADGEFQTDYSTIFTYAEEGLIDVLLMDPESCGFTRWRRICERAPKFGYHCSPHAWGVSLKVNAVAHLAAAFPDVCLSVEGVPDVLEGVDDEGYRMENGKLLIPDRPGFGMEIGWVKTREIYKPY